MKDLLKYGVCLILAGIPSFVILFGVACWLVPDILNDDIYEIEEARDTQHYEIQSENDTVKIATIAL